MTKGISETWSISKVPLLAFSKAPYEMEPSLFSSPNNSCSYFSESRSAPFRIINGFFSLLEFLWIFLAINSFPEPDGPFIRILLSVKDIFFICSRIVDIFLLSPIKSYEENNLFS